MGYTHYWKHPSRLIHDDDILIEIRGHLDKVLKRHKKHIQFESDIPQSPELFIDWDKGYVYVRFNGNGELAHETFSNSGDDGRFCKTARKPYDQAVCECLLILNHYFNIELSSDGFSSYRYEGCALNGVVPKDSIDGTWYDALNNVNRQLKTNYKMFVTQLRGEYISYRPKNIQL